MRVDFVAEQMCSRIPGGTGRYTAELLRALTALSKDGRDLCVRAVVGRRCPTVDEVSDSVSTLGLPGPALARLWERGLPPVLGGSADIVHAPTLLMPPVAKSRLVVTIHDVVPWTHPDTLTPRGVAFHRRMGERASRRADLIITPTDHVAGQVREVLDPRGEVIPIALGVTPLVVPSNHAERRSTLGVGARPYVLFVGTQEPRKGLDVLIEAMGRPDVAEVDVVVAGTPGWGTVDLEGLRRRFGLGDRLHVVGAIPDADLASLYAGAAALALPSRAEGFGIPVVEAMVQRVPVVISEDPALVETSGGHALTAPIGDAEGLARALANALSGTADAQSRVERALEHATALTWATAAERTVAVYRSLDTRPA